MFRENYFCLFFLGLGLGIVTIFIATPYKQINTLSRVYKE